MALINQAKKEISLKIVYWGTGLGGKTVNIIQLSKLLTGKEPIKLSTEEGRTLFFDFSPIEKELPNGYRIRFSVFTTPGQIIYAGARKLLLEGVDGIVFVADSQEKRHEANCLSLEELLEEMSKRNLLIDKFPIVFQYNKRDLPNTLPIEKMRRDLNLFGHPDFKAIAIKGIGVMETFKEIAKLSLQNILNKNISSPKI